MMGSASAPASVTGKTAAHHGESVHISRPAGDFYGFVWNRIRRLTPEAILLRGPSRLRPVQRSSGKSDLDILITTDLTRVRSFLEKQGFYRIYKPQAYLERFRFRSLDISEPYTIDLYTAERWGWGFRLANQNSVPTDPRTACLLHAVADRKGTAYFETVYQGPPWEQQGAETAHFSFVGRTLWRLGSPAALTVFLLLKGTIQPEMRMILRNLYRRLAHGMWQLTGKPGMEVALLGVDGTGKSSLAKRLSRLPAMVKVIYLGPHDFQTRIMKVLAGHSALAPLQKLAYRYEMLVRRFRGWLLAKRGWIVIYDRHPAENRPPWQGSIQNKVKHVVEWTYARPADFTFWLTGHYPTIYERKKDLPVEVLEAVDRRYGAMLERTGAPFERIDVTQNDLDSVFRVVSERILAQLRERTLIDGMSGTFRTALW